MKLLVFRIAAVSCLVYLAFWYLPGKTFAFTVRTGDTVSVPESETITGSFLGAGQHLSVSGTVTGDVICAGQNIDVSGTVEGDIICAGQNVTVTGNVKGNIRAAGQFIKIAGTVARNVTAIGQQITNTAQVGGDMLTAGQQLISSGDITGDILAGSESVSINGIIAGNADFWTNTLSLGQNAVIAKNLTYESPNVLNLTPGATISGTILRNLPDKDTPGKFRDLTKPDITDRNDRIRSSFSWFAGYLILGLLITVIFPNAVERSITSMQNNPGKAFLSGILVLFLTPWIILLLAVTIVGIPVAGLLAFIYAAALIFSRIMTAILFGKIILTRYRSDKNYSPVIRTLVGIVAAWIVFSVPLFGWLLSFTAVLWGLGGFLFLIRPTKTIKTR